MADPLTLAVLGGVAAGKGIKFLYGQAAELLKAWRERRADVPLAAAPVLDGEPGPGAADAEVVAREHANLLSLSTGLAPVAQELVDLDLDDPDLAQRAGDLRELLEQIYHQRITFRGETRDPTGTAVVVRQRVQQVRGTLLGAEAEVDGGASVTVEQDLGTVADGGSATGFKGRTGR
jgi:hypothetical protein